MAIPHNIDMDEARTGTDSCFNQPRSGQSGAAQDKLIEQIRGAATTCFGGSLFQREDEYGQPLLSFAVCGMTERELTRAESRYESLFRTYLPFMIRSASPSRESVGDYTVFNFSIGTKMRSLRELCRSGELKGASVQNMMAHLVDLIVRYYNFCADSGLPYEPLNCLTLDTVYMDASRSLILVPLQAFRGKYAREIPPEVYQSGEKMDERADLYAAAMLAVEVTSGGSANIPAEEIPPLIKECLSGIPECRPSLKKVCSALGASRRTEQSTGEHRAQSAERQRRETDEPIDHEGVRAADIWQRLLALWKKLCAFLTSYTPEEKEKPFHRKGTFHETAKKKTQPISNVDGWDEKIPYEPI